MRIRSWDPELERNLGEREIELGIKVVREGRLIGEKSGSLIFLYKQKGLNKDCFGPRNPCFSGRFRPRLTPVLVPIIRLRALSPRPGPKSDRPLARERVTEVRRVWPVPPGLPEGSRRAGFVSRISPRPRPRLRRRPRRWRLRGRRRAGRSCRRPHRSRRSPRPQRPCA